MANNVIQDNKCLKNLAAAVNPLLAAFNITVDETDTLETVFNSVNDGINVYSIVGNDTSIYPVVVVPGVQTSNAAVVTLIKTGGAGMFIFEYEGELYINHVYNSSGGVRPIGWYQVTTTAV